MRRLDPTNVDWDEFADLFSRYGGDWAGMAPKPTTYPDQDVALLDEFGAVGIEKAEEIRDLFVTPFFCGCEADDPMTVNAYKHEGRTRFGRPLTNAMFGSDISHWDVPVMADVLARSTRWSSTGSSASPTCATSCTPHPCASTRGGNPDFFAGTVVEDFVDDTLRHTELS